MVFAQTKSIVSWRKFHSEILASLKGNRILLSLGQILMQTILAAIFFDFFFGRYFSF